MTLFWLKPSGWVDPWLCARALFYFLFTYMDLKQNPLAGVINISKLHVVNLRFREVNVAQGLLGRSIRVMIKSWALNTALSMLLSKVFPRVFVIHKMWMGKGLSWDIFTGFLFLVDVVEMILYFVNGKYNEWQLSLINLGLGMGFLFFF